MDGIDWDEWIRSDADNINQLRGMGRADDTTLEDPMARPKNSDIREWWHTPIRDLTASQRKQALALYIREERLADPQPLMRLLSDNPNLSIAKGGEMLATMAARPDTDDDGATGEPAAPVRWEPGMLVKELPADLHRARVVISDAQKTARAAHEHPGRWVVYGVSDGEHARRIALEKVRRVVRAKTSAFAPAASFEAQAREVEHGRYVVFCRYVCAEQ
ncbi:hypothetical protein PG1550B_1068 [Bifidobacterium pseudolongum subsp. globosum]|uniref:hypothetical protein n=1 Tax=Bifidobacterium pseudolongum TaxID=1694 RepID=UPI00101F3627|nr:hypothetical protein [Bifidobacterium pseudolongum]RYQ59997.1 hypothetical protein PG1550B_1068 [Bifidobacterium pseudolongum subsp. globosum]